MKLLAALVVLAVASLAHAEADLSSYPQAKIAFNSGHSPSAKQLTSALWMATTVASDPATGAPSGSYSRGAIPDGQGGTYRQIAKIAISKNSGGMTVASAEITYTDATNGTLIDSTTHYGSLTGKGLLLVGQGDAQSCRTLSTCHVLASGTLLCAQSSDDSRPVCTKSYKRGQVSAYLGYKPVHP